MKTFIFSLPARLKSFNEKLDVKGALCGKSWEVFNDEGVKQLFIFNTDGTLLITTNGKVVKSSWQYISANSSVLITTDDETTMFHPAFYDNIIFALQQDGVERYLFMVDEKDRQVFPELTLQSLTSYFENKQREIIEAIPQEKEPATNLIDEERARENNDKAAAWVEAVNETRTAYAFSLALWGLFLLVPIGFAIYIWYWCLPGLFRYFHIEDLFVLIFPIALIVGAFFLGKTAQKYFYNYFVERKVCLNKLYCADKEAFDRANKKKSVPVLIRFIGWVFILASVISTGVILFTNTDTFYWWEEYGIIMGGLLAVFLWYYLSTGIAKRIENKLGLLRGK